MPIENIDVQIQIFNSHLGELMQKSAFPDGEASSLITEAEPGLLEGLQKEETPVKQVIQEVGYEITSELGLAPSEDKGVVIMNARLQTERPLISGDDFLSMIQTLQRSLRTQLEEPNIEVYITRLNE